MKYNLILVVIAVGLSVSVQEVEANPAPVVRYLITIADPTSTIYRAMASDPCLAELNVLVEKHGLLFKAKSTSAWGTSESDLVKNRTNAPGNGDILFVSGTGLMALNSDLYALQLPGLFGNASLDDARAVGTYVARSYIDRANNVPPPPRMIPVAIGPLSRVRLFSSRSISSLSDIRGLRYWAYPDDFTTALLIHLGMTHVPSPETRVSSSLRTHEIDALYAFDAWVYDRGWATYMVTKTGSPWFVTAKDLPLNVIFSAILMPTDLVPNIGADQVADWGKQCLASIEADVSGFAPRQSLPRFVESTMSDADGDLKSLWKTAEEQFKSLNQKHEKILAALKECHACVREHNSQGASSCQKRCDFASAFP